MKGLYTFTLLYIVYMQTLQRKAPYLGIPQILYQHISSGTYNFSWGYGGLTAILLHEMMTSFSFSFFLVLQRLPMVLNQISGIAGDSGKIKHLIPKFSHILSSLCAPLHNFGQQHEPVRNLLVVNETKLTLLVCQSHQVFLVLNI